MDYYYYVGPTVIDTKNYDGGYHRNKYDSRYISVMAGIHRQFSFFKNMLFCSWLGYRFLIRHQYAYKITKQCDDLVSLL
jgi:hypothetical protein